MFDWKRFSAYFIDTVETVIVALILALLIRTFFVQVFFIPSSSMEPTLLIQDRIVVNKLAYYFAEPKREQVVVFHFPQPAEGSNRMYMKKDLVKRIVGLPGETLEVRLGKVYINGALLQEHHTMNPDFANYGPTKIPANSYFMMGDNRSNSADSRVWGFLPRKDIVGPAVLRIWPLTKLGFVP